MTFFKPVKADSHNAFIDAVVSLTSDDNTTYYGVNAIKNSDVFSAIRILASDVASSPIELHKGSKPTKTDKYYNLLNNRPNNQVDGYNFKYALMVNLLLNGNAFAEIDNPDDPQELQLVKNSSMEVKQDDETGRLIYLVSNSKGQQRRVNPDHILHFKCFSMDGITGTSPLMSLRDELEIQNAGNKMLASFYKNGINSNGILKVKGSDLDADAKSNIRTKFEAANAGASNTSRVMILDEGQEYTPMEVNSDVAKLVNSNDWTSKQIAKVFGLSSYQLGIEENHSNVEQTNLNYVNGTLRHWFDTFSSELDFKLLSGADKYNFSFNTDVLLTTDPNAVLENAIKGIQGGVLTINEAREKMNLPPVDGGNTLLVSLNYVHLDNMDTYQNSKNTGEE